MYPGTDMAVLAKLRQLYREAARRQKIEQLYAENPAGLERPRYDPVLYAMFPVLDGDRPVFFNTESVLDLHRVLAVQQELGFPMVLTGLTQSFDAVDKLKSANLPLLLTLELPKEPEDSEEEQSPDSAEVALTDAAVELPQIETPNYDADFRVSSLADVVAEKENLEARREIAYKAHVGNAPYARIRGTDLWFFNRKCQTGRTVGKC